MEKYYDVLQEFDSTYKKFLEKIDEEMYSDAGCIQCYLIGLVVALQKLVAPEADINLVAEIKKRAELIA